MDIDFNEHRGQAGFPVDQPLEALKADHAFVRQLLARYTTTHDMRVKEEAGPRILELLEMHANIEETVFYPTVHQLDPSLVNHSEQEHQEARQLMEQLKGMQVGSAGYDQTMVQLRDAIMHHVQSEEQNLFPKVQQSGMDMTQLGVQMQAYEASMVTSQARASDKRVDRR